MVRGNDFGRCLVVDDDPDILLSAKLLLRDLFRDAADRLDARGHADAL